MAKKRTRAGMAEKRRTLLRYGRHALAAVTAAVLVAAAILAWQKVESFLVEDPRFALGAPAGAEMAPAVHVSGIVHASRARVMRVFAGDTGRSLYLLPVAERRRKLLAVDWVKDATVMRLWPNRVEVWIQERRPVAFAQLPPARPGAASRTALIDADGVLLELPPRSNYDLPVLTGLRRRQSEASRAARVRGAMRMMSDIGPLGRQISEVDVSDPDNLKATMAVEGRVVVLWLGRENFRTRLRNFLAHYPEIHRRAPQAAAFDLRIDDRITALNPAGGRRSG